METWDAIRGWRTIRTFAIRKIAENDLDRDAGHVARSEATIVLVEPVADEPRRASLIEYDLGQATLQMAVTAADLGIGRPLARLTEINRRRFEEVVHRGRW